MRYVDTGAPEPQRKPLVPSKLISGMLPGATQIRIGGEDGIMIDGKNRVVSVSSGDASVSLGKTSTTTLGVDFVDDTGTRRFLAGVYPDNSVKMKLSQPTYDVTTATDDQLIWSSDFNLFKIVKSDSLQLNFTTVSGVNGSRTATYAHNLGYIPKIVACAAIDGMLTPGSGSPQVMLPFTVMSSGATVDAHFQVTIDTVNVYFIAIWDDLGSATYNNTCYFNLLRESFTG